MRRMVGIYMASRCRESLELRNSFFIRNLVQACRKLPFIQMIDQEFGKDKHLIFELDQSLIEWDSESFQKKLVVPRGSPK